MAEAAEARVVHGMPGRLPTGIAYVLVVHDPVSHMTDYVSNLALKDTSGLMAEVIKDIRTDLLPTEAN
jgi:hypothetical protein